MAQAVTSARRILSATALFGDKVVNPRNEELGRIEELMIDLDSGRVAYAILSFGGILGLGDKLFAIPWSVLAFEPAERRFILDVSKELLQRAPGFDKNDWPDVSDPAWGGQIHAYYGRKPYGE
jgi:sporulation protein YlmC with PRC-barrel domain